MMQSVTEALAMLGVLVLFIPPGATSRLQPMDVGIVSMKNMSQQ